MTPGDRAQFAQLLKLEHAKMGEFIELLKREEALLIAGDADALVALTQEKTELYQKLQRIHEGRAMLLGRARLEVSDASIRRVFGSVPKALTLWDEVLARAAEAQERNRVNGNLIIERMQHNQAALSVLMAANNQPSLYDSGGHTRNRPGGGRILGSA